MKETRHRPNWLRRNWKWLVPLLMLAAFFVISLPKGIGDATLRIAKGYSDSEIPEKALEIVRKNKWVNEMLGQLEPIGKMTILEGYVNYSQNADSAFMALTIKGRRGKGKMDIKASYSSGVLEYDMLKVRLKEPAFRKETIPVYP